MHFTFHVFLTSTLFILPPHLHPNASMFFMITSQAKALANIINTEIDITANTVNFFIGNSPLMFIEFRLPFLHEKDNSF